MFIAGHLAWGYVLGKFTSDLMKVKCSLPLLFLLSIAPDFDFVLGLPHRTVTHSVIVYFLFSLPFFVKYGTKIFPYLITISSHSFLDYLQGPTLSFWPFPTPAYYPIIDLAYAITITNLELIGFLISILYMFKSGDLRERLLKPHFLNFLLSIPVVVLLGVFLFGFELKPLPPVLLVPHLTYLMIFSGSIAVVLRSHPILTRKQKP